MRQVPTYGIIGAGRVARHFCHYFSLLDINYQTWSRAHNDEQQLQQLSQNCQRLLLLISDDAIEAFIRQHDFLLNNILIHCSGRLATELAIGAHPLMTFNNSLYDLNVYREIAFIIDDDAPAFDECFPELNNLHYRLAKTDKILYHSLCALAANGSCLLWQKLIAEFKTQFAIPEQAAHALLKQQMQNLLTANSAALTGPLVRNDQQTINAHLEALKNDPYHAVYAALVKAYQTENNS